MQKTKDLTICFYLFFITCIFTSLVSCNNYPIQQIPVGEQPTKLFTVCDYLSNNAIIQQNSQFTVTGQSEKDVVIVVSIYDNRNSLINQSFNVVKDDGSYAVTINTPKASDKDYHIVINDATKTYTKTFNNIHFGIVWMIAGEGFINKKLSLIDTESKPYDFNNISFYHQSVNKGEWISDLNDLDSQNYQYINEFAYYFANQLKNEYANSFIQNDIYIGIICINNETNYLSEWLSKDNIDRIKYLKEYFVSNNKYINSPKENEMGFMYDNYLKPLKGIMIEGFIWSQGLSDLTTVHDNIEKFFSIYDLMLNVFFNSICDIFGDQVKILNIQEPSDNKENIDLLRFSQARVSYYFNNTEIIPTYDLKRTSEIDEETLINDPLIDSTNNSLEIDITKLVKRLIAVAYKGDKISSYAKLIMNRDLENNITNIMIVFSNTTVIESNAFNNLVVYDFDNNIIEIEPVINKDMIELDLSIPLINEEDEQLYYQVKTIKYACGEDIYSSDIFNKYQIPIVPFIITIGGN